MRRIGVAAVLAAVLLVGGCGRGEVRKEKVYDRLARANGFEPPASMSRAEFGGMVVRRFNSMDKDGDGYVSAAEYRGPTQRFPRLDANGDGRLSPEEFGNAALAHFDHDDLNHDGTVTGVEYKAAHPGR